MALTTGRYLPANHHQDVELWPLIPDPDHDEQNPDAGEPEMVADLDNLPDGFVEHQNVDGLTYFYLAEGKRNKPVRDEIGQAIVLVPGGAVVTRANGSKYTLTPQQFRDFERAHSPAEGTPLVVHETPQGE